MKKINIQHEANIDAQGNLNSKHCKPVVCLETGDVYSSATDAAEAIGVTLSSMSCHLTGKTRSVKGKHFCYLSRVSESLNAIVTRLRETAAIEEDARKWQALQAEKEAARKAEEKRLAEIRKAEEKVARLTNKRDEYNAKWVEATNALHEAEVELEALRGDSDVDAA